MEGDKRRIDVHELENNAFVEVPIYDNHPRAKNWLAIIKPDPSKPNGLDRTFVQKAHGKYFYMATDIKVGQALEFGADYYTTSGHKQPARVYALVLAKDENSITLELFNSPEDVIERAEEMKDPEQLRAQADEMRAKSIMDFSDDLLITELERRGYTVFLSSSDDDEPMPL